ncbi:hypothetical protein ACOMHN_034577 [Nucella lapillus]
MPEAALVFRVRCGSFHPVYLSFMAKRAKRKVAMRINVITLRTRLTSVMTGLVLSVFFYSDLILRCGDVELNPGLTKPGSSLRQGRLKSFSAERRASTDQATPPDREPTAAHTSDSDAKVISLQDIMSQLVRIETKFEAKFDTVSTDLKNLKDSFGGLKEEVQGLEETVNKLTVENEALKMENDKLNDRVDKLEIKTDDLEGRSKRNNLIFYGIPRTEGESKTDYENMIRDMMIDKFDFTREIEFDRVHRLGNRENSPIIARCTFYKDKEEILRAKKNLKGSRVFVGEDLSQRVRDIRKRLTPHLKAAKGAQKRATMIYDHLLIEGSKYVLDEEDCTPHSGSEHTHYTTYTDKTGFDNEKFVQNASVSLDGCENVVSPQSASQSGAGYLNREGDSREACQLENIGGKRGMKMAPDGAMVALLLTLCILSLGAAQDDLLSASYPEEGGFSVPGCGSQKMDLILVLDSSQNQAAFQALQDFASSLVQFANPDAGFVRVGLVVFGSRVHRQVDLRQRTGTADLVSTITSLRLQPGGRDISMGLQTMRRLFHGSLGDRPDAPNVALLLTTGNADVRASEVSRQAAGAKDQGIQMFVVGVGVQSPGQINDIASSPTEETSFLMDNIADLAFLPDVVFAQMCVRLQSQGADPLRDSKQADVVFLLHFSNRLSKAALRQVQSFMSTTVQQADVDSGNVRFGAAVYRRRAFPLWQLKDHTDSGSLDSAIRGMGLNLRSASASASAGLQLLTSGMFRPDQGDRPDAPNVVIVLTDANSDVGVSSTARAAQSLKDSGATVFTVGVNVQSKGELESMASDASMAYVLSSFDHLPRAYSQITRHVGALQGKADAEEEKELDDTPRALSADKSGQVDVAVLFHVSSPDRVSSHIRPFLYYLFADSQLRSGQVHVALGSINRRLQLLSRLKQHEGSTQLIRLLTGVAPSADMGQWRVAQALRRVTSRVFQEGRGDRVDVRNVLILLTDSAPSPALPPGALGKEVDRLRQAGVRVLAVGLTGAGVRGVREVGSTPGGGGGEVVAVSDYDQLSSPSLSQRLRTAIFQHSRQIDLAIVLHVQSSTKAKEIKVALKPFLKNLLRHADVDGGNVRVSLSYYRKKPKLVLNLKPGQTKAEVTRAIDALTGKIRSKRQVLCWSLG